jgi:3-methyladenine DNA glycosylase AlkD
MTVQDIMAQLEAYGDAQTKKTLMRHGAKEPFYGVKVSDLKLILKKVKKNHELSLGLYATGNTDAMYLAGLMADEKKITKAQLEEWVDAAYWQYLNEYAVPWVASESPYGFALGLEWIKSPKETTAAAGWSTLSSCAAIKEDKNLDIDAFSALLDTVAKEIQHAPNRVRYTMNGFVVATGNYIASLTDKAMDVANKIGAVTVDMDGTACKVPLAKDYLQKCINNGNVGKKRKMARC